MIRKFLPHLRDFDREVSRMPKTPQRLEALKAIGVLLDFLLFLQQPENLKGAATRTTHHNAPLKTKRPRQN